MTLQELFTNVVRGTTTAMFGGLMIAGAGTFLDTVLADETLNLVTTVLKNTGVTVAGMGGVGAAATVLVGAGYNMYQRDRGRSNTLRL